MTEHIDGHEPVTGVRTRKEYWDRSGATADHTRDNLVANGDSDDDDDDEIESNFAEPPNSVGACYNGRTGPVRTGRSRCQNCLDSTAIAAVSFH